MKFDDPKAGNSLKDRRLCGELKECVPITDRTKKKVKSTVIAGRKQFLSILGHAVTVHKSQGSSLTYMQGDLNRSIVKKLHLGRIINNLYLRVNFRPYFLVPKVVIRFYCQILKLKILR